MFFSSESLLQEPFDNWGGYRGPEVLVSVKDDNDGVCFCNFFRLVQTCGHVPRRENLNKTKPIEIDVILLKNATNRRYKLCRNRRFPKRSSWNSQKRKVQDLVLSVSKIFLWILQQMYCTIKGKSRSQDRWYQFSKKQLLYIDKSRCRMGHWVWESGRKIDPATRQFLVTLSTAMNLVHKNSFPKLSNFP